MKKRVLWVVGLLVVLAAVWAFMFRGRDTQTEVQYRYAKVEKGTLTTSIEATGQLVAKTTVDVKSKAGGKVVQLLVDAGSVVKRGQVIAVIDPADTKAIYDQAAADLTTSQARAQQAQSNYELQIANSRTAVQEARRSLESAKIRLERSRLQTQRQPSLSNAAVKTAEANLNAAQASRERLNLVTIPQMRRSAEADLSRTKAELASAESEMTRQEDLFAKGYVAQSAVEQARSRLAGARSAYANAEQKSTTVERDIEVMKKENDQEVARAQAALSQAKANTSEIGVSNTNLKEAQEAVRQAEIALQQAVDAQMQNDVRRQDIMAAKASTVRSRVSLQNAREQLESTTVVAPRDGVVTLKYLEEGTIIPPGTSTFSQGTSLVQISDTTEMFVEVSVDEADVGSVKPGQRVIVTTEAFRGERVRGEVERINPAAITENNVTAVKVRVRILPGSTLPLKPGMNATCEFITQQKRDILIVPSQAVDNGTVQVKTADPLKPETREVEVGMEGNDGTEIISGLKEGDEVVIGKVDLAQIREIQNKMAEQQSGPGLAGGGPGGFNRSNQNRGGGGTAGGGGNRGGGGAPGMGGGARGGGTGGGVGGGGRGG